MRAPLSLSVEDVASSIFVCPPILTFFSIPTPPSTIRAPLSLDVLSVVDSILVSPPTINFLTIPTPPSI